MQLAPHLNLDLNTFSASSEAKGPSSLLCPLAPTLQPQKHVTDSGEDLHSMATAPYICQNGHVHACRQACAGKGHT